MRGTQIRWANVAKLAGGVGLAAALLFALPSLLNAPDPPPLEPDIGLAPSQPSTHEPGPVPELAPATVPPRNAGGRGRSRSRSARMRESGADRASTEEEPSTAPAPIRARVPTRSPGTAPLAPSSRTVPAPRASPLPPLIREFGL